MDAGPAWWALAGVGVDAVNACSPVLALVVLAVVLVDLAILAGEAGGTVAVLDITVELVGVASTTVTTRARLAGHVDRLAMLSGETCVNQTLVQ